VRLFGWNAAMSKVGQIEKDLKNLPPTELRKIRDWLDDLLEDELEFKPEFEADIRESEREMRVAEPAFAFWDNPRMLSTTDSKRGDVLAVGLT
jgi:hypothetical protein